MLPSLLLASMLGCAFLLHVDGGPAVAVDTTRQAEFQGILEGHTALSIGDVGVGINVRNRTGGRGTEFGAGPEFCWIPAGKMASPYLCAGASLLTLGWRDDALAMGALSPYLQPAFAAPIGDDCVSSVFVSLPVGWDVRLTDQPDSFFAGLTVGFGWQAKTAALKDCRPQGSTAGQTGKKGKKKKKKS